MNFEDSSLYLEVKNITGDGGKPVFFYHTALIHLKNEDIPAIKIVSIDIKRDYEQNFTDELILSIMMPYGKYAKWLYPERSNLEITLLKKPMLELGSGEDLTRSISTERYIAVLINQNNPLIEGSDYNIPAEDALDLTNIITVNFQLIPKSVDQIRMKAVGGGFRGATTGNVLKTVLTRESQALDLPKELLPLGIDMVPPSNKQKRDHVIIRDGTKLIDLPRYIQDNCGGIYSAGIGFYYQNRHWYIYPLYDTDRFDDSLDKITIINVPGDKLTGIERTYRKDGTNTIILATGHIQFKDTSDARQLNSGNGIRFADAAKFMHGFISSKGNKAISARGANVNEIISTIRASGRNNVHITNDRISSNIFREYSKLASSDGSLMNLVWENADPDIIYPGIPIKILYMEEEGIKELTGVVLKAHVYVQSKGQVMFSNTHYTTVAFSVFVNRKKIAK